MLLGSGVKGAGGALLGYASDGSLASGWRCTGPVCSAADLLAAAAELAGGGGAPAPPPSAAKAAGAAASACELGEVWEWECLLLAQLPAAPAQGPQQSPLWLLAISPFPVKSPYSPHQPANPVLYWVGHMCDDDTRRSCALGPVRCPACLPAYLPCLHAGLCTWRPRVHSGEPTGSLAALQV